MLTNTTRPPRPRLTLRILAYASADIFGLTVLAIGGTWFIDRKPVLLQNTPGSMVEAIVCVLGGLVVMIWAVAHVMQEIAKQAPEMQKRYGRYIAENHPHRAQAPESADHLK